MASESPERIAILGAGPIGIEAALYARYLGYRVELFDRGGIAENVCRWGHVRMISPFGMLRSTLGLAALAAQNAQYCPPPDEALLTGQEWVEQYLMPLSRTDLLADNLRLNSKVLRVARVDHHKRHLPSDSRRGESPFRVLVENDEGQRDSLAEIVIDCTGVFTCANWIGRGGGPAVGEAACRTQIDYQIPDLLGSARNRFAGRRILVVGSGHSAANSIVALQQLKQQAAKTSVTWITRGTARHEQPIPVVERDPLPERARLTAEANAWALSGEIAHRPTSHVDAISFDTNRQVFRVSLGGPSEERAEFDRVIANVGYRPDRQLYEELQVHECYASGGPMKLAAALLKHPGDLRRLPTSHGPEVHRTAEPNFYILGAKSYGRSPNFFVSVGIEQVRELFTIIGQRKDLDLYRSASSLLRSSAENLRRC